jgi:hypothetical protein
MNYTFPDSINPQINEGRSACLMSRCLQDNPYDEFKEDIKWGMWKTGYLEQRVLKMRVEKGIPLPNHCIPYEK